MVTPLSGGLLSHFNIIFAILFVWIVVYAMLSRVKFLGENAWINAMVAAALAILFGTSQVAVKIFEISTPWLILFFFVLLMIELLLLFLAPGDAGKLRMLNPESPVTRSIVIGVILIIIFLSAGEVVRETKEPLIATGEIQEGEPTSFAGTVGGIIRQPAVLGLILILMIAAFAVMLLSSEHNK